MKTLKHKASMFGCYPHALMLLVLQIRCSRVASVFTCTIKTSKMLHI